MAALIRGKDPTTGKTVVHDAKWWGRAKAHAVAKRGGPSTTAVNPLSGATVRHSPKAWDAIHKQYVRTYGPEDITAPMGPYDVAASINAAARQKFQPQYQTLSDQTRQSVAQDKNLTDWYAGYKQTVADAAQRSQAANQGALDWTTNFANSSSNLDASQRQALASQQAQSAAARGQAVDPNQGFVGQQADQSRRAALGQFGALMASQGANAQTYMADKNRIASGSELQGHGAEYNRRQGLAQLVRQKQAEEGDYRTTLRGQLQASERQNQLARATFGLNQAKAASSAATAGQTAAQRAAAQRETARHNRATEQSAAANREAANQRAAANRQAAANRRASGGGGKKKGSGGQTPAASRSYNTAYNNVYNYVFNHPPGAARTRDEIIAGVRKVTGAPYSPAAAAVDAILKRYPQRWGTGVTMKA